MPDPLSPLWGGIKSKAVTSSLTGDGFLLKLVYLSFGSPLSSSVVGKPIFDIKATEDKTKISTPMLSGSGKNVISFGSMDARASTKTSGLGFADYSSTSGQGGRIL